MARKIILLSDGTGNSATSAQRTNVWRFYQALDVAAKNSAGNLLQLAFYDDGVGTSGFKPLRLLGGAFGWGLSRNVRDLYESLCRYYQTGDQVCVLGFSRGAYTARVLAHFIITCGILDRRKPPPGAKWFRWPGQPTTMSAEAGFKLGIRTAYKSYRRSYWEKAKILPRRVAKSFRWLRNGLYVDVPLPEEFRKLYSLKKSEDTIENYGPKKPGDTNGGNYRTVILEDGTYPILFLGVWDTVDAVGLPIDELCTVLDHFVYPYKFPDQVPSKHIAYACHALAIDDERHTFHPLLWDEGGTAHSSRIKQVWFAGMHANVGGGYPDDDLAHVSLDWMIKAAQKQGLKFIPAQVVHIEQHADPMGKLYDSRRGGARYYRYKPRRIHDLCNDAERRVRVDEPKIHMSVIDRIRQESVGYSPSGLPDNARLVDYTGNDTSLNPPEIAPPGDDLHAHRVEMLQRAQDHIWWGRVAYFGLLFLTLGLVTLPQFLPSIPGKLSSDSLESFYTWVFNVLSSFLPAFLRYWTDAWTQAPTVFTVFLLLIVCLLAWSSYINGKIQTMAESGWWHVKALPASTRYDKPPKWAERLAHRIRTQTSIKRLYWILTRHIVPIAFLLLCIYLLYGLTYRLLVHYPFVNAGICGLENAQVYSPEMSRDKKSATIDFNTRTPCHNTGFLIEAGATYTIEIKPNSNWRDLNVDVGIDGFDNRWNFLSPRYLAGLPARRHLSMPWFILIGEIGADSGNIVPFKEQSFSFKSRYRGVLQLYVNDAINAWGMQVPAMQSEGEEKITTWDAFYRNNHGSATIKISRRD